MQAIILAAGQGSRIVDKIGRRPKSTLVLQGHSIIYLTVCMLLKYNIGVTVCTGYMREKIQKELEGLPVSFIYNPFYSVMNNMGTLWFARELIEKQDVIIMSADVIFEENMLRKIICAEGDLVMAIDKSRIAEGDYFFKLDDRGEIVDYGPDIPYTDRDCEYVGICKLSARMGKEFKKRLERLVEKEQLFDDYLEKVFFTFLSQGLHTVDVSGMRWREIDHYEDYLKAQKEFGK